MVDGGGKVTVTIGYRGDPVPAAFNMARYCIGRAAAATPDKAALVVVADPLREPSEVWTYTRLETAILNVGGALAQSRLSPGARILIRLDNTSDYALMFFGAVAAGLVPIPASTQLTDGEVAFLLENSGAEAICVADHLPVGALPAGLRVIEQSEVARMISDGPRGVYTDTAAEQPAYLIYTSGTTSRPKGVLHAHRAAWGRRPMYQGWYGISPDDRILHAGAFNWTYTLGVGLTDAWANGATAVIYTGPKDPALWPGLIAAHGATIFAAVPGLYRQIMKYGDARPETLGRLRHGLTAGEAPPPGFFEDWLSRTGLHLYESIGMSELSTFISTSPTVPRREGAIGRPQPGRSVVILDVDGGDEALPPGQQGLLAAHRSDPGLMLGYWNRPEEEAEVLRGDWFIGGDLASMDDDNYVSHHGRANDIMKAGGYRVSPQEVEAVIAAHPGVADVACVEIRVRADVSIIAAFVVAKPDAARDAEAIKAFAAERLAAYKRPREVVFVDQLPRTPNGKLKRAALAGLHR
jgi:acetyl-CoA synthetase